MKQTVLFDFPNEEVKQPIVNDLIKNYNLNVNILRASIDYNGRGFLLSEIEGDEIVFAEALKSVKKNHVIVNIIESAILIDHNICVNCGACTSVCPVDALSMGADASLVFDSNKCIDCKLCVVACPTKAIRDIL